VDYGLTDRSGRLVGRISGLRHLAKGAGVKWPFGTEVREHVIELADDQMSSEISALLVAVAASVYLVLQRPLEDGGDL
jgi:hypothetical protein